MNLAIIIGVEKYQSSNFDDLLACKNDAKVVSEVLNNVKDIKETLYINDNEAGYEVKRKISDLIEKYKGEVIDELFFYFTGHGDRYEDDFFYLLSDFDLTKRESTGLRNSEVDDWIKTLSPKLCVKVVDACFSGTQYIKSESNTEIELKKSAQKYGLNDIYFWFSSRENQASFAGKEFSRFTESILTGITEHSGDVRYREIMAYVADDFSNKGDSKPIFVTQADNIEKFGHVTKSTHKLIYDAFGIELPDDEATEKTQQTEKDDGTKEDEVMPVKAEPSVFELIKIKSDELCFNEDLLLNFIEKFNEKVSDWDEDIKSIYEIEFEVNLEIYQVPNESEIGVWLEKNKSKNYFAESTSGESTYQVEEYKALPKNPSKSSFARIREMGLWGEEDDTEYKLETVNKTRSYINGFNYTHNCKNRISRILFKPKVELAQPLSVHVVPIYSNKHMVLHVAYEVLKRNNWKSFSQPQCLTWKMIQTNIDSINSAELVSNKIQAEIKSWIESLLAKSLEQ